MPLLKAKIIVQCPKENTEINAALECPKCRHFSHYSYVGNKPLIACAFPAYKEYTTPADVEKS